MGTLWGWASQKKGHLKLGEEELVPQIAGRVPVIFDGRRRDHWGIEWRKKGSLQTSYTKGFHSETLSGKSKTNHFRDSVFANSKDNFYNCNRKGGTGDGFAGGEKKMSKETGTVSMRGGMEVKANDYTNIKRGGKRDALTITETFYMLRGGGGKKEETSYDLQELFAARKEGE